MVTPITFNYFKPKVWHIALEVSSIAFYPYWDEDFCKWEMSQHFTSAEILGLVITATGCLEYLLLYI